MSGYYNGWHAAQGGRGGFGFGGSAWDAAPSGGHNNQSGHGAFGDIGGGDDSGGRRLWPGVPGVLGHRYEDAPRGGRVEKSTGRGRGRGRGRAGRGRFGHAAGQNQDEGQGPANQEREPVEAVNSDALANVYGIDQPPPIKEGFSAVEWHKRWRDRSEALQHEASVARSNVASVGSKAPTVEDLQKTIRDLEEKNRNLEETNRDLEKELGESRKSWSDLAENMVSKGHLDNTINQMFNKLAGRDDERATKVIKVAEFEKRGRDAEQKLAALEASAQSGTGHRSRKRPRLPEGQSSSPEGSDETLFKSMCSSMHKAMSQLIVKQSEQHDLSIAGLVRMTQAFAYPERKDHLMKFIKGDKTGKLFCVGSLMFREDPSAEECMCNRLEGTRCGQCLSVRVLDRSTMEVRFVLVDLE